MEIEEAQDRPLEKYWKVRIQFRGGGYMLLDSTVEPELDFEGNKICGIQMDLKPGSRAAFVEWEDVQGVSWDVVTPKASKKGGKVGRPRRADGQGAIQHKKSDEASVLDLVPNEEISLSELAEKIQDELGLNRAAAYSAVRALVADKKLSRRDEKKGRFPKGYISRIDEPNVQWNDEETEDELPEEDPTDDGLPKFERIKGYKLLNSSTVLRRVPESGETIRSVIIDDLVKDTNYDRTQIEKLMDAMEEAGILTSCYDLHQKWICRAK